MGISLNPGRIAFEEAYNSDIFIDKTEMLMYLNTVVNTQQRFVSVSRPRRFGKTISADMICTYYGREADSRGLFDACLISSEKPRIIGKKELTWDCYLG